MSELNDFLTNQLKEMGFEEAKIKRALQAMPNATSIEPVMEWIITHEDDESQATSEAGTGSEGTLTLRPDAEKADDQVPKTEEEKEEAKRRYEELIKQRRSEREEKEKQEALEREISRRKQGSEIVKLREKMEQEERIRAAEQRRRDKEDDKVHRQKVLEQIKRDREAFNARNNPNKEAEAPAPAPAKAEPVAAPTTNYDQCRLGIRLPDGSQLVQTFQAKEPLAAVKVFIELNRKDRLAPGDTASNFNIIMPPNTPFKEEDFERPLQDLGLCPSARLIVSQKKAPQAAFPAYDY